MVVGRERSLYKVPISAGFTCSPLLPNHQPRPFIVQESPEIRVKTEGLFHDTSHATVEEDRFPSSFLEGQYTSSKKAWDKLYSQLPLPHTEDSDQTPPWLKTTGISRWIAGFNLDKKELQASLEPFAGSKDP